MQIKDKMTIFLQKSYFLSKVFYHICHYKSNRFMGNKHTKNYTSKSELHDKILTVTQDKFHKLGIRQVRMDDIAKDLSISKRTLYEIFKDKETLLLECAKRKRKLQKEYMMSIDYENTNVLEVVLQHYKFTAEKFPNINPAYFEDLKRYPIVTKYLKAERTKEFNDVVNYFKSGIEQNLFRSDVNMELFIRLLNTTFDNALENGSYKDFSIQEIYRTILFTFLRGIATEKGMKIIDNFIHP